MTTPYEVGDVIVYTAWGGVLRTVRVLAKHEDIKYGRPGFDAVVIGGDEDGFPVWGYDFQIVYGEVHR